MYHGNFSLKNLPCLEFNNIQILTFKRHTAIGMKNCSKNSKLGHGLIEHTVYELNNLKLYAVCLFSLPYIHKDAIAAQDVI